MSTAFDPHAWIRRAEELGPVSLQGDSISTSFRQNFPADDPTALPALERISDVLDDIVGDEPTPTSNRAAVVGALRWREGRPRARA